MRLNGKDYLTFYKSFPDIGEEVKDSIIAVKRRISYAQAPFELKEENMTKILSTDEPFYVLQSDFHFCQKHKRCYKFFPHAHSNHD